MRFLVDEDSEGDDIVSTLRALGHEVILATVALHKGAKDPVVAKYAEAIGAILVTRNKRDFWRMLAPRPAERPRRFKQAGALFLMCGVAAQSARRMREFDGVLQKEHDRVSNHGADPRFLAEIVEERVVIHR